MRECISHRRKQCIIRGHMRAGSCEHLALKRPGEGFADACRHDVGPVFEPVQLEPALDCSEYTAETHELWLLQLPMDVSPLDSMPGPTL